MDVLHIDDGVWHVTGWGEAQATYRVRLGDHPPQPVVVRIEASTLANADLAPELGFGSIEWAVDAHARSKITRLAITGRVSPEIVMSMADLAAATRGAVSSSDRFVEP